MSACLLHSRHDIGSHVAWPEIREDKLIVFKINKQRLHTLSLVNADPTNEAYYSIHFSKSNSLDNPVTVDDFEVFFAKYNPTSSEHDRDMSVQPLFFTKPLKGT